MAGRTLAILGLAVVCTAVVGSRGWVASAAV